MTVAYDNSAEAFSATAATTLETPSFAVGGTNRYLLAFVGTSASTPVNPSSVRWGGAGGTVMTQKGSTLNAGSFLKLSCFELINPTTQTSTVHATWGSAQDERWIITISFSGVDQATPTRTVASGTGTGSTLSQAATSVAGDVVVDSVATNTGGGDPTLTVGAGQTGRQEIEGTDLGGFVAAGGSTEDAAGASTTMSWTPSLGGDWAHFAMALIAAAGGGGVTLPQVERGRTLGRGLGRGLH